MDQEFHYHITFLVARAAGFDQDSSRKIAFSSQHVDDNLYKFTIFDINDRRIIENDISQTFDIRLPEVDLIKIYSCFHFPPLVDLKSIKKKKPILRYATNQYNNLSKHLLFKALKTRDPYLIGIASHVYQDSFAHHGFSGRNELSNTPFKLPFKLNLGHAYYGSYPDMVGIKWQTHNSKKIRDNNKVFINAAISLYNLYSSYLKVKPYQNEYRKQRLKNTLMTIFGKSLYPFVNIIADRQDSRITQYNKAYELWFDDCIPSYEKDSWLNKAAFFNLINNKWVARSNFQNSDWYSFQKGVKLYKKMHQELVDYAS